MVFSQITKNKFVSSIFIQIKRKWEVKSIISSYPIAAYCKHQNLKKKIQWIYADKEEKSMEQNASAETSCCSSSNIFTVKVLIIWLIVCLPSNIFGIICMYGTENNDIPISPKKQSNISGNGFINNSLTAHQNFSKFTSNHRYVTRYLKIDPESVSILYKNHLLIKELCFLIKPTM